MVKIHITGNSGSGKTTLAARLGQELNLEVFGLDKTVWQPGWVQTPRADRVAMEQRLVFHPEWIIEGVSAEVREAADIVIFLDVGRWICLRRSMARSFRHLFDGRPELPEDCPEILFLRQQIGIVWQFGERTRPQILMDLAAHRGRVFVVRSAAELEFAVEQVIGRLNH